MWPPTAVLQADWTRSVSDTADVGPENMLEVAGGAHPLTSVGGVLTQRPLPRVEFVFLIPQGHGLGKRRNLCFEVQTRHRLGLSTRAWTQGFLNEAWDFSTEHTRLSTKLMEALAKLLLDSWGPPNWGSSREMPTATAGCSYRVWPARGPKAPSGGSEGGSPSSSPSQENTTPFPPALYPPSSNTPHPREPPKKDAIKVTHPPSPKQPWTSRTRFHLLMVTVMFSTEILRLPLLRTLHSLCLTLENAQTCPTSGPGTPPLLSPAPLAFFFSLQDARELSTDLALLLKCSYP